ncbi:MAG: hypothetical protein H6983_06790 [Ectothiorhodospiraceae bacterium]|nr:hypothetical protein [Chromatiales bacterium]MCP5153853.1 hypothetical protein [Ectothiorhodospiraceae bacterium]
MDRAPSRAKTARPISAGIVARERLLARLDRERAAPVVWVHGPPGCGKTSLVASYLESRGQTSLWYQLDAADGDVATFFWVLHHAAARSPGLVADGLHLPLYTAEYHDDPASFARRFFRVLFASIGAARVLVLDNYQEVPSHSTLHGLIADAVREIPPESGVVIASRSEPPAAMARLRANRELRLIGFDDLRLSREESDAIARARAPRLQPDALARLYDRTQGWAAGLVLMLDQVERDGGAVSAVDLDAPQALFDYLAGEVYQRFDAGTRAMLVRTAYLPRMTVPMAETVAREPGAGARLEDLYRTHRLVTRTASEGDAVFQYHPLLAAFLRARASTELPARERVRLVRDSAAALEAAGAFDDALAVLREAHEPAALASLVLRLAPALLAQGRVETLEALLDELEHEPPATDPWFVYWRAVCRQHSAPRESRRLHEQALEGFSSQPVPDDRGCLSSAAGVVQALVDELDDLSLLDVWVPRVLMLVAGRETLPWPDVEARVSVSVYLALALRQPRHPQVAAWARRAHRALPAIEDPHTRVGAQLLLATALIHEGRFGWALDFIASMRATTEASSVSPLARKALKGVESMYYMLTGDDRRCLEAVHGGLEIGRAHGLRRWSYQLLANGAAAALGAGDVETARELLARMHDLRHGARRLDRCTDHYYRAWLAMLEGDVLGAYQEQKQALRFAIECGSPFYEVLCRVAMAQVLAALGEVHRAAGHLRVVHKLTRDGDNRLLRFNALLVLADITLARGWPRVGMNALRAALRIGREMDFRHCPGWRADMMARLARRALAAGIEVEYVQRLVRGRDLFPEQPPYDVGDWPWRFRVLALGPLEVRHDEQPVGLGAKPRQRPVELLKILVALGPTDVPEATVTGILWPRIDGDYASRSLATTLHRLRRLLGDERVVSVRQGHLSLDPRLCWVDVCAFDQVADAVDALVRGGPEEPHDEAIESLLVRLHGLYRGPLLASDEAPYLHSPRVRVQARLVRATTGIGRLWEARGEWERAAACHERGLDRVPTAEAFYRRLMLCHAELGRRTDVMDVFDRCRATLASNAGSVPSPETVDIYEHLIGRR